MKVLKRIINYIFWIIIAFILSFGYTRIILGPKSEDSTGLMRIFDVIYDLAFAYIGLYLGGIIAILFILLDVFYLNKKLGNHTKATLLRLLTLIIIAITMGGTHYILEKVIDVI